MNIFFLSLFPEKAAKYHVDKHVVKMILEYAQLLCSAHHMCNSPNVPYKLTHKSHPAAIWVRQSSANYKWLVKLALALCREYSYRYGDRKHKTCLDVLRWAKSNTPKGLPNAGFTEPPQCMPDDVKVKGDAVLAYRQYYIKYKSGIAKWTRRRQPYWYKDLVSQSQA